MVLKEELIMPEGRGSIKCSKYCKYTGNLLVSGVGGFGDIIRVSNFPR
jgi:hypothetical protein